MQERCSHCGLLDSGSATAPVCVKYGGRPTGGASAECEYYTPIQYDDDARLSPLQHLLLRERELRSKHMKGPVW